MAKPYSKTLTRHGNSTALVLDKPLMEAVGLVADSQVEIRTDGRSLLITPVGESTSERKDAFQRAMAEAERIAGPMLARLAER